MIALALWTLAACIPFYLGFLAFYLMLRDEMKPRSPSQAMVDDIVKAHRLKTRGQNYAKSRLALEHYGISRII